VFFCKHGFAVGAALDENDVSDNGGCGFATYPGIHSGITDYKTSLVVGEEKLSIEYPIPSPSPIDIEI